jgi:hypothetical protein
MHGGVKSKVIISHSALLEWLFQVLECYYNSVGTSPMIRLAWADIAATGMSYAARKISTTTPPTTSTLQAMFNLA